MYKLVFHKNALKFVQKRTPNEKLLIDAKLKLLQSNPYPTNNRLDIKKLQNSDFYRLRINAFRFIYEIIEDEVVILMLKAGNRGEIYK